MKKVISFPNLAEYYVPISFLLRHLTDYKVVRAPKITKKTIDLGYKYSPEYVCLPFKFNLGNYIEVLEKGADVLIQFGGGCRYGYYAELQETILKDLGYEFTFYKLVDKGNISIKNIYKILKEINPKMNIFKFCYYFLLTFSMIFMMDSIDHYIRKNIGFEKEKNSFKNLKSLMLRDLSKIKGFIHLFYLWIEYSIKFRKLKIDKPKDCLKVGVIGELFGSMEPNASYFLEEELAKMHIEIKRWTNVSYLLVIKKLISKFVKFKTRKYLKYKLGADGSDNVYRALYLCKHKYDGIIHIKPFGCTPEISAIPVIQNVCNDYKMPIIFFSFDTESSTTGIKTRLEAFYDMLVMKKEKKND